MMSDRERWIVYPLLFAALAMGGFNRMKTSTRLTCHEIECNRLIVTPDPRDLPSDEESSSSVVVSCSPDGGFLELHGSPELPEIFLGHHEVRQVSGLLATNPQGRLEDWGKLFPWPEAATDPIEDDNRQPADIDNPAEQEQDAEQDQQTE